MTAYGKPTGEEELQRLAEILGLSFGHPAEATYDRFSFVGPDNLRIYRDRETLDAGLWLVPMGQWFGKQSVPMTGIAAVGVAPEARGRGLALGLMNETMKELHERKIPLSALYPATQTLYRKSGYEQAGSRFRGTVDPGNIRVRERSVTIRPVTDDDRKTTQTIYNTYAKGMDGHLDRGPYIWDRIFTSREQTAKGYLAEEDGKPTGYLYMLSHPREGFGYDLQLTDFVALTPRAGRGLWSFLADHRSMSGKVTWYTAPGGLLPSLLPEQPYKIDLDIMWMLRITEVATALETRGYSPSVRAKLPLKIDDDLLPGNNGSFVLEVEGGRGRVSPGGTGNLAMDVRALASLYSGFSSPWSLSLAGQLEGDEKLLSAATGVFSAGSPWMPDMF